MRTISGTSRTISEYFEDTLATEPRRRRRLPAEDVDPRPDERRVVQCGRRNSRWRVDARSPGARAVPARAARRIRQLVSLSPSAARVSARPAAHQDGRPNPRSLSPGLSLVRRTRDVERGGPLRDRGRGLPAGHRVHRELRDVDGGQRRPPDVAELGAASAQGADELPARGQAGPRLGHEPRHPLQGSRRAADAGRGRHTRKRPAAICGGGVVRRARYSAPSPTTARAGRDLAIECLAGHRFDFVQLQRALQRSALRLLEGG